jgi:hypothetical protein
VLSALALLAGGGVARAVAADDLPRLDERTALMIGANRLKLGVLAFEYGILERVSVGTDPPAWMARAVLPVLIPNLHLKVSVYERGPVALTVQGGGYYARLNDNASATGALLVAPLSLFASFRVQPRVWLHAEGTYNFVHGFGAGDLNEAGIGGSVAAQAAQTGLMVEWRVKRIFSITALGRFQPYTGPLAFAGSGQLDPYTTVDINGSATARVEHPWMVIGGVAFLWRYVHLTLGAGYGYYFIPGLDLPYPHQGFVPDGSVAVIL